MDLDVFALVMSSTLLPPPLGPQVFIFIGETLLSMNWAIVADILLVSRWPFQAWFRGCREQGVGVGGLTCLELWPLPRLQNLAPE